MNNVTITLFIKPDSLFKFIEVIKVLDSLPLENTYVFNPVDIEYSEIPVPSFNQVNVPVELYLKFRYSYNKLKNLSKN